MYVGALSLSLANAIPQCFKYIVTDPPRPLNEEDIWFQIGHVHEQQKDVSFQVSTYRRVLDRDPKHAKVLQQLGWLHHQQSNSYTSQDQAIEYLEQSVSSGKVLEYTHVKLV
jgi:glucose repression mediator protein